MFGWRAKIGMMIPTNNTVIEPEMAYLAPEGVTFHATRMVSSRTGTASIEGLHNLVSCVDRASEELSITGVDSVLYGCLSTSFAVEGWDDQYPEKTGVWMSTPAITALEATCLAIKSYGITDVAVLCPYGEALQKLAAGAFARHGLNVKTLESINVTGLRAVCSVPERDVYQAAKKMDKAGAPLLCILATDLSTATIINELEHDLGMPVVSTNQALCWASLHLAGVHESTPQGGSLFTHEFKR